MSSPVSVPGIVVENLRVVARDGAVLLDDFSAHFRAGEVTVVLGENGAGKTTLLTRLQGIAAATSGAVRVDDRDIFALPPRSRACLVAALGQEDVDAPGLTTAARIAQGLAPRLSHHNLDIGRLLAPVQAVASELALTPLLDRPLAALSGGERRRVHLARALVDEGARAFVLDEPHAGVDARHVTRVSAALRRRAEAGATVVVTVHDLVVALELADRVVGIACGHKVCDGSVEEALTSETLEALYGFRGEVVRERDLVGVLRAR